MRRPIIIAVLFAAGCAKGPNPDTEAAAQYIRGRHSNVEIYTMEAEEPEYATVSKIPDSHRVNPPEKPAACAVRVRFSWGYDNRTTHNTFLVWVTDDHKAFDWSADFDSADWRQFVRSHADK